jgi:hypothetical protein
MRASTSKALLGALLLAGCSAETGEEPKKVRFQHASHVARGLDCTDCHGDPKTAVKVAMPTAESCRECHDGKEKITADIAAAISEYCERPADARHLRPQTYADIQFAHSFHAGRAAISCETCHGKIAAATPNPEPSLAMTNCQSCHATRSVSGECATCHSVWSQERKPESHGSLWNVRHGAASRMTQKQLVVARTEDCTLCHAREACDQCHATTKPKNHTEAWRTATHGLAASMDRTSCQTCHGADSCERCHNGTPPPRSHRAGFGAPRDLHCLTCHDQLGESACNVCHKGTPDHNLAAPKPANHTAGMNCRQCHGHGQPLPHVDNGTDCNSCHH